MKQTTSESSRPTFIHKPSKRPWRKFYMTRISDLAITNLQDKNICQDQTNFVQISNGTTDPKQ